MLQKILIVLAAAAALVLNIVQVHAAQLSANPWVEANDDEVVAEIYRKEQRRHGMDSLNYQAEEETTIDRTYAYIQNADDDDDDAGVMEKIKNMFGGDADEGGEEKALVPNTAANRRAMARQKQNTQQESSDFEVPILDFKGQTDWLQHSLTLPKLPSMTEVVQSLERASGVNFKQMRKYLK